MPRTPINRALWAVLLLLCLLWIGLAAGTAIGALFVPKGSGLAGPAIALGYGVLVAVGAAALGAFLIWKLPVHTLRSAGRAAGVLALAMVGAVAWRAFSLQAERRTERGLDAPLPLPMEFHLHAELDEIDGKRSFRELDVDGSNWSFRYVAVGPGAAACHGTFKAAEAVRLIEQLIAVDKRLAGRQAPCAAITEPLIQHLAFRGRLDASAAPRQWSVDTGRECLRQESEAAALGQTLWRLPIDGVSDGRVRCE